MKLSNIFKKAKAKNAKPTITKMDKNQLSKVIGGIDNNGREIKVETAASGGNY